MKVIEHLSERHLYMGLYSGVYVDEVERVVTFLLWNLSGRLCGFQQYRPDADKKAKNHPREGRYYTFVGGERKNRHLAVWGLESLSYRSDILVVCEGIFDACRFHNFGIPAVAILSNNNSRHREWLDSLGRKLYAALDDHATKFTGTTDLILPDSVADFGECSDEQVRNVLTEEGLI